MCKYALVAYKPHLACFDCRKTFRRRLLGDISEDFNSESTIAKCPECGESLADMGLDFKSPPKKDIKEWKHMSELYKSGITFHSCGCSGPGYIPKDREALLTQLDKMRTSYIENLRAWKNYIEPKSKKERELRKQKGDFLYPPFRLKQNEGNTIKEDATAYWTTRVNEIETRINNLTNKS